MSDEIVARLRGCVCYASTNKEWPNVLLQEAADLIERQAARIAELEKDAARYRWLRHIDRRGCLVLTGPAAGCWIDAEEEDGTLVLLTEEDADAAIDAAMSREGK